MPVGAMPEAMPVGGEAIPARCMQCAGAGSSSVRMEGPCLHAAHATILRPTAASCSACST